MPAKRPHPDGGGSDGGAGPSRKEQRIAQRRDARKIDTGPAPPTTTTLPPQLDVEQTLSSRKFEILSLLKAIKSARNSSSTRAWQLLPRHARRRAASHNILRLPTRLRRKGLAELKASTTEPKTRSDVRKRSAIHPKGKSDARRDELVTRAGRKGAQWLESHLWFAKRFRMSRTEFDGMRWGYVVPEEPFMKGKRTDWRAMSAGCALWDSSWDQWVRVAVKVPKSEGMGGDAYSRAAVIAHALLDSAGIHVADQEPQQGAVYHTMLHSGNPGPSNRAQCPVTVYVVPSEPTAAPASEAVSVPVPSPSPPAGARPTHSRHLRKTLALLPPPPPLSELYPDFEVLLRVHPAGISQVLQSLKRSHQKHSSSPGVHIVLTQLHGPAASTVVGNERKSGDGKGKASTTATAHHLSTHAQRTIESRLVALNRQALRSQAYNVFELYGPLTGSVLGGVLKPVASTDAETMKVWERLTTTRTQVASRARMISMRVLDPRLGYPYRNRKIDKGATGTSTEELVLPPHTSPQPHLFRDGMRPPTFSKGDLDQRRAKLLVPGTKLKPDSRDDVVPIVLIQRSAPHDGSADSPPCLAGYTLIIPQHWSRPFLHSLFSTSVRPLSLSGHRILHVEAGIPCYPFDWVGSPGWAETTQHEFHKRRAEWLKRPPAKRVNYESLDVMWPFGGVDMWSQLARNARRALNELCDLTLPAANFNAIHIATSKAVMIQQVQAITQLLTSSITISPHAQRHLKQSTMISSYPFVLVKLEAIQRGTLDEMSEVRIPLSVEQMVQWISGNLHQEAKTAHVGSITSGSFSLSRGKGFALGAVARDAWVACLGLRMVASQKATDGYDREDDSTVLAVRHVRGGPLRLVTATVVYV